MSIFKRVPGPRLVGMGLAFVVLGVLLRYYFPGVQVWLLLTVGVTGNIGVGFLSIVENLVQEVLLLTGGPLLALGIVGVMAARAESEAPAPASEESRATEQSR